MAFHVDHHCFYFQIWAVNGVSASDGCVEAGRGTTMAVSKLQAAL